MEVREKVSNEDLQAYLKTLVEKSKVAQKQFERDYTKQRPIDEVVRAIGKAVCDNGKTLGEEAFAETGMGNVESKIAQADECGPAPVGPDAREKFSGVRGLSRRTRRQVSAQAHGCNWCRNAQHKSDCYYHRQCHDGSEVPKLYYHFASPRFCEGLYEDSRHYESGTGGNRCPS